MSFSKVNLLMSMLVFLFLCSPCPASGADRFAEIDAQVSAIQNMELATSGCFYDIVPESQGIDFKVYRDSNGSVRIFSMHAVGADEYYYDTRAFYGETGNLLLYLYGGYDNGGGCPHIRYYYIDGKFMDKDGKPASNLPKDALKLTNAGSLSKVFDKELNGIKETGAIRFQSPQKNDSATIQGMSINIREKPDVNSPVVGVLNAMDSVTIIEVGKRDKIGDYGENCWYKISACLSSIFVNNPKKVTGWVYGAFIPPVEKPKK